MRLRDVAESFSRFLDRIFGARIPAAERFFASYPEWPVCAALPEMRFLIGLSANTAKKEPGTLPDGATLARRCLNSSAAVRSYHSRMLLEEQGLAQEDGRSASLFCLWLIDHAKPANFRVTQVTAGEASHNDFDRWATIGEEHYEWLVFQLLGGPQPTMASHRNNQFLTIDKWLRLLEKGEVASVGAYRDTDRPFLVLEYDADQPSGFLVDAPPAHLATYRESARLWIDPETSRLAKGVFEASGRMHSGEAAPRARLQQIFGGYDHEMRFEPGVPFPELASQPADSAARADPRPEQPRFGRTLLVAVAVVLGVYVLFVILRRFFGWR